MDRASFPLRNSSLSYALFGLVAMNLIMIFKIELKREKKFQFRLKLAFVVPTIECSRKDVAPFKLIRSTGG